MTNNLDTIKQIIRENISRHRSIDEYENTRHKEAPKFLKVDLLKTFQKRFHKVFNEDPNLRVPWYYAEFILNDDTSNLVIDCLAKEGFII